MNYSSRKHIERMMGAAPSFQNDPLGIWPSRLLGMNVVKSPDIPRYELPAELLPGIPWPPGFREEFNQWSRSFLGTTNLLPRGVTYVLGGHTLVIRSEDVVKISNV